MAVKSILMNTEMVLAILNGKKTCTRKLPRKQIEKKYLEYVEWVQAVAPPGSTYLREKEFYEKYPPYQPGDILYVRETWDYYPEYEDENAPTIYYYKADGDLRPEGYREIGWLSPFYMPKEAARIWLRVTDVRVERLQDITAEQVVKEGVLNQKEIDAVEVLAKHYDIPFAHTWDCIIKESDLDRYGWQANPWVWVIDFERCEKP